MHANASTPRGSSNIFEHAGLSRIRPLYDLWIRLRPSLPLAAPPSSAHVRVRSLSELELEQSGQRHDGIL